MTATEEVTDAGVALAELTVPLSVLAVYRAAAPENPFARWSIRQVRFGADAEGCYAAATDTAHLVVARWRPAECPAVPEFGVPADAVELCYLAARRFGAFPINAPTVRVCDRGGSWGLVVASAWGRHRLDGMAPEGKYPPWRTIFEPCRPVAADPCQLAGELSARVVGTLRRMAPARDLYDCLTAATVEDPGPDGKHAGRPAGRRVLWELRPCKAGGWPDGLTLKALQVPLAE